MSDLNVMSNQNVSAVPEAVGISIAEPVFNEVQQQMIERLTFLTRGHDNDLTIQMMRGIVQKVLLETLS